MLFIIFPHLSININSLFISEYSKKAFIDNSSDPVGSSIFNLNCKGTRNPYACSPKTKY